MGAAHSLVRKRRCQLSGSQAKHGKPDANAKTRFRAELTAAWLVVLTVPRSARHRNKCHDQSSSWQCAAGKWIRLVGVLAKFMTKSPPWLYGLGQCISYTFIEERGPHDTRQSQRTVFRERRGETAWCSMGSIIEDLVCTGRGKSPPFPKVAARPTRRHHPSK